MFYPTGVTVDSASNVYIADYGNNRVRKVAANGIITTIAGNDVSGYSGDGELAVLAQLHNPLGVAVDSTYNIYVADTYNNVIRKVTASTGIISTIAGNGNYGYYGDGGLATLAQLRNPSGVAVDSAFNVYIADTLNHRIRKVTASTGIITTIAGINSFGYSGDGGPATSAQLRNPYGVAVADGTVFIADTFNNRIRVLSYGIITTVAGTGTIGFSGDGDLAYYAKLNGPTGVAVDCAMNLFIVDESNNVIRKVTASTGIITTVAGSISPIAPPNNYGSTGDGGPATSALLYYPFSVTVDPEGDVLIADQANNRIRLIQSATIPCGPEPKPPKKSDKEQKDKGKTPPDPVPNPPTPPKISPKDKDKDKKIDDAKGKNGPGKRKLRQVEVE